MVDSGSEDIKIGSYGNSSKIDNWVEGPQKGITPSTVHLQGLESKLYQNDISLKQ